MALKENLVKQFNYCNAIASDIIANEKSKEAARIMQLQSKDLG